MLDYPPSDLYERISKESQAVYSEKGSKFIAHVFPINKEEEVTTHLKELKKAHPKSRHVVYAFRLHPDRGIYRYSDDGEPAGSSGLPTYNALQSFNVHEVMVATVRYFGGTKLGIPGLNHAYRTAAELALVGAAKETALLEEEIVLTVGYNHMNVLYQFQRTLPFEIEVVEQTEQAVLRLRTARSLKTRLLEMLSEHQNIIFVL